MDTRIKVLAALWIFQVANYLDRVAISFAGPSIMKSLSLDPGAFGIVLSSFGVGYFLAQIPGGLLADRVGAKALLVVAPLFWALFTGLTGLVAGIVGFVIVRACLGVSEGASNAACYKVIGDNFTSKQRAFAGSIWATAFAVGPALAGPLVGILVVAYGWQAAFVALIIPALLAALVNWRLIPGDRPADGRLANPSALSSGAEEASFRTMVRQPALWLLSLLYLSFNIAFWGYLGWMPSYLALEHHIDVKAAGMLGGIPYLFAFFGLIIAGWLGSNTLVRFRPQLAACCYVGAGLSLYIAYTATTLTLSLAGLSSAAFFLYGALAPFGAIVLEFAPARSRAAYSGVVNTAGQIGGAVAPGIVGFLVSATGTFASGFGFMIVGLCVAAACMLALVPYLSAARIAANAALSPVVDA